LYEENGKKEHMKSIIQILRQVKAIFKTSLNLELKRVYSDFFKFHEDSKVLMLHRKDLYASGPPRQHISQKMLELVTRHAGHKILDIGCSYGIDCRELNRRGFSCVGIEANYDYYKEAKSEIEAYFMRAEKLKFPDKSFDTAIMLEVLEHLDEPFTALAEIVRVVRKNLILSVPNLAPLETCVQHNVIMHHFFETTHVNFFTKPMLERFLNTFFPYVEVKEFGQFFNVSGKRLYYHLSAIASFEPIK
jgi:ubiquinone/menaquinone biosynthesis C-methylase UbiE